MYLRILVCLRQDSSNCSSLDSELDNEAAQSPTLRDELSNPVTIQPHHEEPLTDVEYGGSMSKQHNINTTMLFTVIEREHFRDKLYL